MAAEIDFKGEQIVSTSTTETEGVVDLKKAMKYLPELIGSIMPNIKNVELQQGEAIFLWQLKENLIRDLRINEKKIAKFMKEQGDGHPWNADDDIKAVEKLLEIAAVLVESDNYPRSIWMNFLIKIWCHFENNLINYTRKHPGRNYLQDIIHEQNEFTHRIAEDWVKEKTGKDIKVAHGDRENFKVKEVEDG